MKKVIILSGHGNFATGIQSSIEFLAGRNEDIYYIDFLVNDTEVLLKEKFNSILDKNTESQVLFICDILGGTPFKTAAEIANENEAIEVVAGCNVGSIIQTLLEKDSISIGRLADNIINLSRRSTIRFKKVSSNEIIYNSLEMEDGI
jgi:PTS system N-acetylgalactosamine-specific IIA component